MSAPGASVARFQELDRISRRRALTDRESDELYRCIRRMKARGQAAPAKEGR